MEIRVLGPVRIRVGTESVEAGPAQRRAVLAALAVDAGRPVMISTLVDRVWETEPPAEARAALYSYISRLRRLLAAGRRDGHTGTAPTIRLVGRGAGYLLDVEPETVDLHRFRRLVAAAGEVGSDHAERAKLLGEALQLWSGPPLADLPGQWAARMRSGWQQERLDTTVQWTDAQLQLCRGGEAIGPVRAMLEEHPLAEPLVAALMRALVMAGRHAEAAECYAAARARLADELGIEPGVQLRAVHLALLRGELDRPSGPASPLHDEHGRVRAADPAVASRSSVEWQPVPRQLPAPPPVFTGRTHEVATLSQAHDASTVVITAIDGMAGVGKTALAVHVAHRIADRYPDGQLYLDLHGYTRAWTRPSRPRRSITCCARWASPVRGSRPALSNGRRCTGPGWPASGC